MGEQGMKRQRRRVPVGLLALVLVTACHGSPSEATMAQRSGPALASTYMLRTIDGAALPAATGPDSARRLVDSARFDVSASPVGAFGFTLTLYGGGISQGVIVALSVRRIAADSFMVQSDVPGAPPPDLYIGVRDSTLVLHWRPQTSGPSLAAFVIGPRDQDWLFRAR